MTKISFIRNTFIYFSLTPSSVNRIRSLRTMKATSCEAFLQTDEINWISSLETHRDNSATDPYQVSILSWNVLAQSLFDSSPEWYEHVHAHPNAPVSWKERLPRIMEFISAAKSDIVCLQEVEYQSFYDIKALMKCHGYSGTLQRKKRSTNKHGYGVATFHRNDKFLLLDSFHRSRTMMTLLEDYSQSKDKDQPHEHKKLAIVNCHLEGNPKKSVMRVKQLQNTLKELALNYDHNDLIVCGDMNSEMSNSACSTYLEHGSCKDLNVIKEWNQIVPNEVTNIPSHSYRLKSAYPSKLTTDNRMDYVTFVSRPHSYAFGLDQIWYHDHGKDSGGNLSVKVKGIKNPFRSPQHRQKIMESGLPSADNPSDHLPIGCILEWNRDRNTKLPNLCLPQQFNYILSEMSEAELKDTASKLIDECQFESDEQRQEFHFIIDDDHFIDGTTQSTETSKDIELKREHRARKRKFLGKVSNEVVRILEQVIKLKKAAFSRHSIQ